MRYLSISLLHPKIIRGGGQQVAYEVFKGAQSDSQIEAHLLAGMDPAISNANVPPGAVFTGLDDRPNENLMMSYGFNVENHLQNNWFVIEKLNEFFSTHIFDWIHIHHSLFVGLDIIDVIKKQQPDAKIIYTLHEYLPICLADGQLKKTYNKSLCYDPSPQACFKCFPNHSVDFFFLRNQLFMQHFELVDHFVTPSEFARDRFIEWGIAPKKITVIANGQENINKSTAPAKIENFNNSKVKFAFFGQMIDNKGAHLLLEAASLMAKSAKRDSLDDKDFELDFELHFYGGNMQFASQEYRDKMESLMQDCNKRLKRNIYFHGEYTHEQISGIMQSVDCVITPSTWFEVFGLVVSEAWMFGKPVIAADIGGLSERIFDGKNGLKFQPNDANDLAKKMRMMIDDFLKAGKPFSGIVPPMSREEFWLQHKKLFQSLNAKKL